MEGKSLEQKNPQNKVTKKLIERCSSSRKAVGLPKHRRREKKSE